jgi:hypothetical protein
VAEAMQEQVLKGRCQFGRPRMHRPHPTVTQRSTSSSQNSETMASVHRGEGSVGHQ